jgi:hypothetical protein
VRGPKSAGTRAISSQNALHHGFTACHTTLLKCENPDEFEHSIASHFVTYHPAGPDQEVLVNEMISARWRIRRLRIVETRLIDLEMMRNNAEIEKKYAEPDSTTQLTEAVRALLEDVRSLSLISRYESRLFRMHDRCYRTLRELQRVADRGPQGSGPVEAVEPEPVPPIPHTEIELVPAPSESQSKDDQTNPPRSASSRRETLTGRPQLHHSAEGWQPGPLVAWRSQLLAVVTRLPVTKRLRRR